MEAFDIFRMNMKFYREKKGWNQSELAIQANSSNGMIGNIESGKAKPSFDNIIKIANALEINPADLFLRDASKSQSELKTALKTFFENDIPKLAEERFSVSIFTKNTKL